MKKVEIYQLNDFWSKSYLCDVVKITDKRCFLYIKRNGKNELMFTIDISNYIAIKIMEVDTL